MPRTPGDLPPELSAAFNVQLDESFPQACGKAVENLRYSKQLFCKASPVAEPNPGRARGYKYLLTGINTYELPQIVR